MEADSGRGIKSQIEEVESQEVVSNWTAEFIGEVDKPYLTSPDTQKDCSLMGMVRKLYQKQRLYIKSGWNNFEDTMSSDRKNYFCLNIHFRGEDKGTYTLLRFVYVEDGGSRQSNCKT